MGLHTICDPASWRPRLNGSLLTSDALVLPAVVIPVCFCDAAHEAVSRRALLPF